VVDEALVSTALTTPVLAPLVPFDAAVVGCNVPVPVPATPDAAKVLAIPEAPVERGMFVEPARVLATPVALAIVRVFEAAAAEATEEV